LRKSGHDVVTAADAFEGQDQLTTPPGIDLMILDVAMPKLDGLTFLRQVRADGRFKQLPIIMLTASCDDQDHLTARAEGADEFLTKPASSHLLIETVDRLLSIKATRVC
jgi:two-component system chemotaxis response regulator CheY